MTDQPKTAHPNCAASGCPCLGSMTRNTTGTDEWFCAYHFSAEGKRWTAVTAELQRLGWLVAITKDIRARRYDAASAAKVIAMNQSGHLQQEPHESEMKYLARLEGTLQDACKPPAEPPKSMFQAET